METRLNFDLSVRVYMFGSLDCWQRQTVVPFSNNKHAIYES